VNAQTADSAATGTAIFSGVKTNIGTIGFDAHIVESDASSGWYFDQHAYLLSVYQVMLTLQYCRKEL